MINNADGGEAILEAFRNLHVDYVISSPGSEWPSFWEALARQERDGTPGPTYIDCGHEILAVAIACAYTQVTGKMQAVLLHAGAGLMQGSMAVSAARAMGTPMLIMSGESLSYGESNFDPGAQWYRNLGVVGGPQRLIEPIVKWAQQVAAPETLYESVVRAGELAQRVPKGPTYLCVPMDTMIQEWARPDAFRNVPSAPPFRPTSENIGNVARLIAGARNPLICVDNVGPQSGAVEALVELADLVAIPVIEGAGASYANFPKSNNLHLGSNLRPHLDETDLVLLVESYAPWYPPSEAPRNADIVALGESPLKGHMVYQVMNAGHYLEGNVALTLRLLTAEIRKHGVDTAEVSQRRARVTAAHRKWLDDLAMKESNSVDGDAITVPFLMKVLRDVMPAGKTTYVDETIIHAGAIRNHVLWDDPRGFFRAPSGLGQGLGYALGVKLALPEQYVVTTIGDGTFMYNPIVPALALADEHALPLLIIIANNGKYSAMQFYHDKFYPNGTAASTQKYYGVHIQGPKFEEAASMVGGYGRRVEQPTDLEPAIREARKTIEIGKTAILNVIIPDDGSLR